MLLGLTSNCITAILVAYTYTLALDIAPAQPSAKGPIMLWYTSNDHAVWAAGTWRKVV